MENENFENKVEKLWTKSLESREETKRYLLSIDRFKSYDDWEQIIRVFLNLNDYFLKEYSNKINEFITIGKNKFGNEKINKFLISFLKDKSKLEFDYSNFLYLQHQQHKKTGVSSLKTFTHGELIEICNGRIQRFIESKVFDIEKAFGHFYSCWDHVDEENKVHITEKALTLMRNFIDYTPEQYLSYIIRHQTIPVKASFSGYYYFVLEPFTDKIFGGWGDFELFLMELKNKKGINQKVINCNINFFERYKSKNYSTAQIHENEIDDFVPCIRQLAEMQK